MIPFAKYSGAGNDFVVVAAGDLAEEPAPELARRICPRPAGVGVDGLVTADRQGPGRARVRFFNPDGSEIAMCGNGTRCVARWLVDEGRTEPQHLLVTEQGPIRAEVGEDQVALVYRLKPDVEAVPDLDTPIGPRPAWLVRIGVPHLVLPLDEMPAGEIGELCRPLRSHEVLGPEGANVNLVRTRDDGPAEIRTWERGVEGETSACGSGAMAVLLALGGRRVPGADLRLRTRSGAELRVTILEDEAESDGDGRPVRLRGPARRIFPGRFPRAP